ncbi:unnamed protein product [Phytomonas sp. Hart1]|nr:unnamed protein product [Phytomonas sp. Hart1]|eukprot:CCW70073.1 unnamed protein product [Phytomonas sp. isolate Hart1]
MNTTLNTKRDVREHAKVTLEPLLEDDTIDAEDLKLLVKSVTDAIALPTTPSHVQHQTLEQLLRKLEAVGAGADVLQRIRARLPSPPEEAQTPPKAGGGSCDAQPRPALFDLGALKAHMSKKREELHQQKQLAAKQPPGEGEGEGGIDHTEGQGGEASKASSGPHSEDVATMPSLLPDAPADLASPSEGTARAPLSGGASVEASRGARTAPISLTAAPVEDDLYADLVPLPRERADFDGGHRGVTRGWRGRGGWRGGLRPSYDETFNPFYPSPEGYVPQRASKNWQGYNAHDYNYYSYPY